MTVSNKRIACNTVAQYIRTILNAVVALLGARFVLQTLGVNDYGIYTLVAGVIAMFGFISNSLVVAIQRFLACAIADDDILVESRLYSASQIIHIALGTIIFLILVFSASYIVSHLNISADKREETLYVFYLVSLNFVFTVVSVPQQAALVAYEKIIPLCLLSIIESLLKLFLAIGLPFVFESPLLFYAAGLTVISFVIRLSYTPVLRWYIPSLRFSFCIYIEDIKRILHFAGMNLFGGIANLARNQGVNVLLNLFFGTVINASYSLANQINSQLLFFSTCVFQSSNSQIMQCSRRGEFEKLGSLLSAVSRFAFSVYFVITVPLFICSECILEIWLGTVPPYSSAFVKLMLLCSYTELFSVPLMYIIQAKGRINAYFIVVSLLMISSLPVSYFLLHYGFKPYVVYFSVLFVDVVLLIYRIWFVRTILDSSICRRYILVLVRCFLVCLLGLSLASVVVSFCEKGVQSILLSIVCTIFVIAPFIVMFLSSKEEKGKILVYVREKISK